MKNDREFINGIYEKAQKLQVEEKLECRNKEDETLTMPGYGLRMRLSEVLHSSRTRAGLAVVAMAAVVCIVVPNMLSTKTNDNEQSNADAGIELSSYEDENQRGLPVSILTSSGTVIDQYSSEGEAYYLIEQGDNRIILYNNGLFNEVLKNVKVGNVVEFSYVDTEVTVSEEQEDKIKTKFIEETKNAEQLHIYPIDSIQIKE